MGRGYAFGVWENYDENLKLLCIRKGEQRPELFIADWNNNLVAGDVVTFWEPDIEKMKQLFSGPIKPERLELLALPFEPIEVEIDKDTIYLI